MVLAYWSVVRASVGYAAVWHCCGICDVQTVVAVVVADDAGDLGPMSLPLSL